MVQNQSSIKLQVPSIMQVVILDDNQKEIIVSDFPSPVDSLIGGSTFDYEYVLKEVSPEISNILVRFKIKNSEDLATGENENSEKVQTNVSKSASGRTVNKEKAAKLKKVFE